VGQLPAGCRGHFSCFLLSLFRSLFHYPGPGFCGIFWGGPATNVWGESHALNLMPSQCPRKRGVSMTLGHQIVVPGNPISGISLIAPHNLMANFQFCAFDFDVTHTPRRTHSN